MAMTAPHDRRMSPEEILSNAAAVLGVDARALRALREPSAHRQIPVRLWLLGEEPIYVSTAQRAEELQAADRSYQLTVR
ncbi:hypothetical protein [Kocuria dechangensis]|nr:hypothetical protein [Kocuria dechangensis]